MQSPCSSSYKSHAWQGATLELTFGQVGSARFSWIIAGFSQVQLGSAGFSWVQLGLTCINYVCVGDEAVHDEAKEMVTPLIRKNLEKQGLYAVVIKFYPE